MSIFAKRKEAKERLERTAAIVDAVAAQATEREPKVSWLSDFLEQRNNVNGFGTDFEFSLSREAARRRA